MKSPICALLAVAFMATPALAGPRYDRKLEQAAMRIVAEKIGDIRGGFSYRQKPRFVVVQDTLTAPAQPGDESPSIIAPAGRPRN